MIVICVFDGEEYDLEDKDEERPLIVIEGDVEVAEELVTASVRIFFNAEGGTAIIFHFLTVFFQFYF